MSVQSQFNKYYQKGYVGDLARPDEPHAFDLGVAQVPTGGRKPRPGDAVYYDRTNNGFAVPTSAELQRQAVGIVSYDPGLVQSTLDSPPSNANSDRFIEFDDGDPIKVCVMGTVWAIAGSAIEYGDLLQQDSISGNSSDYLWDLYTPDVTIEAATTVAALRVAVVALNANLRKRVFECVSPAPVAASAMAQVRIGYGRTV